MLDNLPLIVFLICFVLMFVLRMPIPTGMIAACTMYFLTDGLVDGNSFIGMITGQEGQLHLVAQKTIEAIFTNTTIIAVPLFIFAANVMNAGKITEYVFRVCKGLVGRFPGGPAWARWRSMPCAPRAMTTASPAPSPPPPPPSAPSSPPPSPPLFTPCSPAPLWARCSWPV